MSAAAFDAAETALLAAVLDTLVPRSADGRLPGAGELGLAGEIAAALGDARTAIAAGLRALGAAGFAAQDAAGREARLRAHAESDPGFVGSLVFHTYAAYYWHPRVQHALGLEGRPPYPKGYPLEQADLDTLLEGVRRGPRRYRDA